MLTPLPPQHQNDAVVEFLLRPRRSDRSINYHKMEALVAGQIRDGTFNASRILDACKHRLMNATHLALLVGNPHMLRMLLEVGSPPVDPEGFPLLFVAVSGSLNVADNVDVLLQAGMDPNICDGRGNTPLSIAVEKCRNPDFRRVIQSLLAGGAHANADRPAQSFDGSIALTLLARAIEMNHPGTVDLLLASGADPRVAGARRTAEKPWSALDLAEAGGTPEIVHAVRTAAGRLHAIEESGRLAITTQRAGHAARGAMRL